MSTLTTHRLDTEALFLAIFARAFKQGVTLRHVAAQVGVSASTITRIKQGRCPDADGLLSLLVWLERGDEEFTVPNVVLP